ncbi:uncharacterized protein DS421_4g133400 [Arachis hypogaea]|nr:uncharacterized protein DS421_4g133400 [Arachis hypogaea]
MIEVMSFLARLVVKNEEATENVGQWQDSEATMMKKGNEIRGRGLRRGEHLWCSLVVFTDNQKRGLRSEKRDGIMEVRKMHNTEREEKIFRIRISELSYILFIYLFSV